jgi:hypothetical protein
MCHAFVLHPIDPSGYGRPPPAYGGYGGGGYAPSGGGGGGSARDDNPPCNTLFVGNLSDHVDENELRSLFDRMPVRHGTRHRALLPSWRSDPDGGHSSQGCSYKSPADRSCSHACRGMSRAWLSCVADALRAHCSGWPRLQGFRQLKMSRGPKATLGFVEFEDIPTAMAAHAANQNVMLGSR